MTHGDAVSTDFGLVFKAALYAARKHRDQRRKDPGRTPYINHPLDVAHILWFEGEVHDPQVLAAAILHDTIEDTDATREEIQREFGAAVASLVAELTDDKTLHHRERKRRQIVSAPHASEGAKLIKLADKLSNLRDMLDNPPEGWPLERRARYFCWAKEVVAGLGPVNRALESAFQDVCDRFIETKPTASLNRATPAIQLAGRGNQ